MKILKRYAASMLGILMLSSTLISQQHIPTPGYVPPDIAQEGEEAHFRQLAIIETNCTSDEEIRTLWRSVTEQGAVVAIISSPQRMLAWVPDERREAVLGTVIQAASGSVGVLSVSYSAEEFEMNRTDFSSFASVSETEADEAVLEYLEYVRTPKTAEELEQLRIAEAEALRKIEAAPLGECLTLNEPPVGAGGKDGGAGIMSGHATKAEGLLHHSSFFVESKSGTGMWDWDNTVYVRYRILYTQAITFWTSFAAKYGKTLTTSWHLFGPSSPTSQVSGEPTVIGEDAFVPFILTQLTVGSAPTWPGIRPAALWAYHYNTRLRSHYGADEAFCSFIAYKPTPGTGIWPHAEALIWGGGGVEGLYFTMDIQYSGNNPLAATRRNVMAHEIGHLLGAPDEYHSTAASCAYTYRGMPNVNCQKSQPAYGKPSYMMTGFDGIMMYNYTAGTSLATPVHTGILSAANAAPVRSFRTLPNGIPMTVSNCDGIPRTYGSTVCLPVDFDYCMETSVPATRTVGGTLYYFEMWKVRRKSGSDISLTNYGLTLPSYAYTSTRANPVVEITAQYTSTPPDIMSYNPSLQAYKAPLGHATKPGRALALHWPTKYDMRKAETVIEYRFPSGSWHALNTNNILLSHPLNVEASHWTGVRITSVPVGGSNVPIAPGTKYEFRIVGYFNTVRGTESRVASVTTRPATPVDTTFCYDTYEPNNSASPRVLPSMGPGIDPYVIRAASTIDGISGEFAWQKPKADYYRLTAIGLDGGFLSGNKLYLKLVVTPGSVMRGSFRAKRVGTSVWLTGSVDLHKQEYVLVIGTDGEYIIEWAPDMKHVWGMYSTVDPHQAYFAFGEYRITVERKKTFLYTTDICPTCVRIAIPRPVKGLIVTNQKPPADLLVPTRPGWDPKDPKEFEFRYIPPPGSRFVRFVGDRFGGTQNPLPVRIDPTVDPGEYVLTPVTELIPKDLAELVVINPEGPGGPLAERIREPYGALVSAEATAPADFEFVGWGGDTTAATNPLPVVLWKHKRIVAYFREKPCVPEKMPVWVHGLKAVDGKQGNVTLEYAMQPGAGDGLEAGQTDLPPFPPPGTFDARWINIPGSQGSDTDHRAVKPGHVYQGRIQTGSATPVTLTWLPPPLGGDFKWEMKISGVSTPIDMHKTFEHTFDDEGVYMLTVDVHEPVCFPPTQTPDDEITVVRVDPNDFPCINLELLVKDSQTGEVNPYPNPFAFKAYETGPDGVNFPAQISDISHLDSTLFLRICLDPENKDPDRHIVIIVDDDDKNKKKDTTEIKIDTPVEDDEDIFLFSRKTTDDWEMVSLPVKMKSTYTSSLYPGILTLLFHFDPTTGSTDLVSEMDFGKGYWLRTSPGNVLFIGSAMTDYMYTGLNGTGEPAGYGWNMIGSLTFPLAISSLDVTPAGSMLSIFGWDPAAGYVVPATIEPGDGYWVRVKPGTTINMHATPVDGGGATMHTSYEKAVDRVERAATLFVNQDGASRQLAVSAAPLDASLLDLLALPPPPPEGLFDARFGSGTLFAQGGSNVLELRGDGLFRLELLPVSGALGSCRLYSEDGQLLHSFNTTEMDAVNIEVEGLRKLFLAVEAAPNIPVRLSLEQNYPNPFRTSSVTVIPYQLQRDQPVRLEVFDLLGRKVRTLVQGSRGPGLHSVTWNGLDDRGTTLPAGMYIYRLEAGGIMLSRTISIVK